MTMIRVKTRVGSDGNVTVPIGTTEAGRDVEVTVTPVEPPATINGIPRDEWWAILKRTEGSLPDFHVLPEAMIDPIQPLDSDADE